MNRALALSLEAFRRPRVRGLLLGVCLLGLAWACTGGYVLWLLYRQDIFKH